MAVRTAHATRRMEFGDFQTPAALARDTVEILVALRIRPRSILEPTCGVGAYVEAAALAFPEARSIAGFDIDPGHLEKAETIATSSGGRVKFTRADFFRVPWEGVVTPEGAPWLIIGNPPWVTVSGLGGIDGANMPAKSNFHRRAGIEAITGKSNFDISEWMLMRYLDWLKDTPGTVAVLCKTTVARKVLLYAWERGVPIRMARIYKIDAMAHFDAAVDACFFILDLHPESGPQVCGIYPDLQSTVPSRTIGMQSGRVVFDPAAFDANREILGPDPGGPGRIWRSGVKHDCSKVMELIPIGDVFLNGLGETVRLEKDHVYPMLKGSDIGNSRTVCRRHMLVTQRSTGADTAAIAQTAPQTWQYLEAHGPMLDNRASSIYRGKPRFSVFGVGGYTFAPWKVAICGLYKTLRFVKVGPVAGRPVVFDDTVSFLSCETEAEADLVTSLLRSERAETFFRSLVHWDEKRPVTAEILKKLSLEKLADLQGLGVDYAEFTPAGTPSFFGTG